jgi:hypothetical protein
MAETLESLVSRFLSTAGIVDSAGYRTIEVLPDEEAQPYFGGLDHLKLAFSPEAFHENPDAELVTYGSSFLDKLDTLASIRGKTTHFYLRGLIPTTGRTLEKVLGQVRMPGHIMDSGVEQLLLFHHAFLRFKVSLIGEEREEMFFEKAVDLHTGWTTTGVNEQSLHLFIGGEMPVKKELALRLSLAQAYQNAREKLLVDLSPLIKSYQENLTAAYLSERKQVSEHYEALLEKIETGKNHKGADVERLESKARATRADLALRLQDLEKRYRLGLEIKLNQIAMVSYLKAAVPLRLQQGKAIRPFVAIWDSLTRQGYIAEV